MFSSNGVIEEGSMGLGESRVCDQLTLIEFFNVLRP